MQQIYYAYFQKSMQFKNSDRVSGCVALTLFDFILCYQPRKLFNLVRKPATLRIKI